MRSSSLIAGLCISLVMGGLFGADYFLKEAPHKAEKELANIPDPLGSSTSSVASTAASGAVQIAGQSSSASSSRVVKKGFSTKKFAGVDVPSVLAKLQLISKETAESSFLSFAVTDQKLVKTEVLLLRNDRAFLFSWLDSPDAKTIMGGLKQILSEQFSGKMTDLIDENRSEPGKPPVEYLSFMDPTLTGERVIIFRVRSRLYEIHVAENGQDTIDALVEELSK